LELESQILNTTLRSPHTHTHTLRIPSFKMWPVNKQSCGVSSITYTHTGKEACKHTCTKPHTLCAIWRRWKDYTAPCNWNIQAASTPACCFSQTKKFWPRQQWKTSTESKTVFYNHSVERYIQLKVSMILTLGCVIAFKWKCKTCIYGVGHILHKQAHPLTHTSLQQLSL